MQMGKLRHLLTELPALLTIMAEYYRFKCVYVCFFFFFFVFFFFYLFFVFIFLFYLFIFFFFCGGGGGGGCVIYSVMVCFLLLLVILATICDCLFQGIFCITLYFSESMKRLTHTVYQASRLYCFRGKLS